MLRPGLYKVGIACDVTDPPDGWMLVSFWFSPADPHDSCVCLPCHCQLRSIAPGSLPDYLDACQRVMVIGRASDTSLVCFLSCLQHRPSLLLHVNLLAWWRLRMGVSVLVGWFWIYSYRVKIFHTCSSAICPPKIPWERYHVSHARNSGQIRQESIEAEAKASVGRRAPASKVRVPL